jgi:DNA-binding transcriptional LysR family regulator
MSYSLREFRAVAEIAAHKSFRAAAANLEISPSSLSHIVASVEKRLGIRLFQRNTRSVALTEAGEAFLARMRPALGEMMQAIEGINDFRERPAGLIRINTSSWGAERILPIVLGFMHDYPDIRVDLFTEGRLIDIVAEGFDAGLRLIESVPQDMVAIPLGIKEALVIVAAPAYLERHGRPLVPVDLLTHDCIRARLPSGALMRWEIEKAGEIAWVDVTGRLIVGDTRLGVKAALAGAGIAYVEARDAEPHMASGELVQLLAEWTPPFEGLCFYYPRQKLQTAAFRAFVDYFRAHRPAAAVGK